MRIVIDLQGAQTRSRFRGIGRYATSFTKALIKTGTDHEFILVLNGLFPHTIDTIREEFSGLVPQDNILVWQAPGPVSAMTIGNQWRHRVAELLREAFIESLRPDLVHITNLLEGYTDNSITSIGQFDQATPVSALLYDLIPLVNPEQYLNPYPLFKTFYTERIRQLTRARLLLAISDFSRLEGEQHLSVEPSSIASISSAVDPKFSPAPDYPGRETYFREQFSIDRPYVLYTGGADDRKNLPALIRSFSRLPTATRRSHQLVIAGKIIDNDRQRLRREANASGLSKDDFILTGYVSDEDLILLYSLCTLFVFPSWHEGFGLPALEAMACGAPVIGANNSSLPEVIGLDEALFDPGSEQEMTDSMAAVLSDPALRERLKKNSVDRAELFSWEATASRANRMFESIPPRSASEHCERDRQLDLVSSIAAIERDAPPSDLELARIAACIDMNMQCSKEYLESRTQRSEPPDTGIT
jgi:glycosyltransferase involved in cell wall biosynthesis